VLLRRARIVVSKRYKAVYVRVPKVANTSIRHSFGDGRERRAYFAFLRFRYPEYLIFSFVRNPWSRLVSTYQHKILEEKVTDGHYRDGVHRGFVKRGFPFRAGMPFEEFADFVCALPDSQTEKHLKSQCHFLVHRGLLVPGFIGRFETIARDWAELCGRLGAQIKLVRYNRTHGAPYPTYYTTRLVDLVGDRYHNDVVRFGYRFDSELLPRLAADPG
jgi:chondroitin 4-sulfotransferase 11